MKKAEWRVPRVVSSLPQRAIGIIYGVHSPSQCKRLPRLPLSSLPWHVHRDGAHECLPPGTPRDASWEMGRTHSGQQDTDLVQNGHVPAQQSFSPPCPWARPCDVHLAPETQVGVCQMGLLSKLFVFLINEDRFLSPFPLRPSLFTCDLSMMRGGGVAVLRSRG